MVESRLAVREPFDGHVHFREKATLRAVAMHTARRFPRGAVVMPNLVPPVTTPEMALNYKGHIQKVVGGDYPLIMTGYLTEDMHPDTVVRGFQSGAWQAMKYYPRGLTTNAHHGVEEIRKLKDVLKVMGEIGMPALFHGEKNVDAHGERADIYDRERLFYENDAQWLIDEFPTLKMSFEHGSTAAFAEFMVAHGSERIVGTITVQHLLFDRNDFFADGPDVHLHCYPVLKRWQDREALRAFATSGHSSIFAGTDSAPHPTHAKERACGCAGGVFSAHAAVELYTGVFEEEESLEHLENFLSINGPRFYGLPPSNKAMVLEKKPWTVDSMIEVESGDKVRPLLYHEDPGKRRPIRWKIV